MSKRDARTIVKKESEETAPRLVKRSIPESTGRVTAENIYDHVTKTKHFIRHFKFPDADKLFPHQPANRAVDKYYPMAEGGPIYIDEPIFPHEEKVCEKKRVHMRERKLRYIVVKKDTDMISVMEQLAEK